MSRVFDVAIAGATGAVGQAFLEILAERNFPIGNLYLLAGPRSDGQTMTFRGHQHRVGRLDQFDFSQAQIGLFSAGGSVSAEFAPKAAEKGCVVVDNTSHFRYDDQVPLVVPEVNGAESGNRPRNIIANPNCSTIQMAVVLNPIHREVGISRINVCTYQAVSGAGQDGINELALQTTNILNAKPVEPSVMPVQIAFNAIPQIGPFQDNGYTQEEMKLVWETHKIFGDDSIQVNPTCARVPVFYGHSEALHVETREPIAVERVRELLGGAAGVQLVDEATPGGYPTAVSHSAGHDPVFVGRLRKDISHPNGLNMWLVADNVRKGAALNSVQIAEYMASAGTI